MFSSFSNSWLSKMYFLLLLIKVKIFVHTSKEHSNVRFLTKRDHSVKWCDFHINALTLCWRIYFCLRSPSREDFSETPDFTLKKQTKKPLKTQTTPRCPWFLVLWVLASCFPIFPLSLRFNFFICKSLTALALVRLIWKECRGPQVKA